jgi:hypothetical protein
MCNDSQIISHDDVFHLDHSYINNLTNFSQWATDSFHVWKSLGIQWNIKLVPELPEVLSLLQVALHHEFNSLPNL